MQRSGDTVYILDDDLSVRDSLALLLGLRGHAVAMFSDAESFLKAYQVSWRGCILVDIRMPGMDGLTLQTQLQKVRCAMPVVVMTGHGDVASARRAFRANAVDFLEKPLNHEHLLRAIEEALSRQASTSDASARDSQLTRQLETLTPREREIMEFVVAGRHNRDIAQLLGISARTVEVHKARMMAKLGADSIPALVRMHLKI